MRMKLKKHLVRTTALTMSAAFTLASIAPAHSGNAKAKGPKLSKKSIRVVVKKAKKVKLKNASQVKKTKWSVKNKKIAKLTKRKRTSIVVKGKKTGKTTVTARMTLKGKRKAVKLQLKVQVVKNAKTTQKPDIKVTSTPSVSPGVSGRPSTPPGGIATDDPTPPASGNPDDPTPPASGNPDNPTPPASGDPNNPTPPASDTLTILIPDERTGIRQGETLSLTVSGANAVTWSVAGDDGASIDANGHLTVAKNVEAGTKLTVMAQAASDPAKKDTKTLTVVENQTAVLTDRNIQLNQTSDQNLTGFTFRSDDAYSIVTDPQRGNVTRFDASQGYVNSSYDMLAWVTVDPAWAGKTVTMSAYLKYEASEDINGNLNLVLNENWEHSNPAYKWDAQPDTWYFVTGTYTLPEYTESRYDGNKNRLYIVRDDQHLAAGKNAVYYISDLVFSVEKAEIDTVTVTTEGDADEIYQNHDLQCSATVSGTGVPSQKVIYSIDPPVEGVSISDTGLLSVKKAAAGAKINVTAASIEDPEKSATKTVTVLAQAIDSLTVTAEESPKVIYQGNELQFSANVNATGDPSEEVTWSLVSPASGVTLVKNDKGARLKVGMDAADGTKLQIKATSAFDQTKSDIYEITVKANQIVGVTVKTAGDKETVSSDLPLNLSAVVDNGGTTASTDVTWSLVQEMEGVSLSTKEKNATLTVVDEVAAGTSITVRATSVFDPTKQGEVTVTVKKDASDVFDLNKLTVEYWQDFAEITSQAEMKEFLDNEDGIFSYQTTVPDNGLWNTWSFNMYQSSGGLYIMDDTLSASKKRTKALGYCFGSQEDYLQFAINNPRSETMKYTLTFLISFQEIALDSSYLPKNIEYTLPLKLVLEDGTVIKDNIGIPYRCYATNSVYNREFYEVCAMIDVPAGKKVYLQLKLNGDLPTCQTDQHYGKTDGAAEALHPVVCRVDNVSIVGGKMQTVEMKVGDTYQLEGLDTVEGDTVTYYTNSQLAKYAHDDKATECTRFETTVAAVDENGLITANKAGDTALIAEIKHENGDIERKQCIIHVE